MRVCSDSSKKTGEENIHGSCSSSRLGGDSYSCWSARRAHRKSSQPQSCSASASDFSFFPWSGRTAYDTRSVLSTTSPIWIKSMRKILDISTITDLPS